MHILARRHNTHHYNKGPSRCAAGGPLHGGHCMARAHEPAHKPAHEPPHCSRLRCRVASVAFPALQIASRFRRAWDMGLAMLLAYAAITVPYRWGGQTCPRFKCTDWQPTRWL